MTEPQPAPEPPKWSWKYAAACAVMLLVAGGAYVYVDRHPEFTAELDGTQARGGMLVVQIERFRSEKHRLPYGLGELGVTDSPFYYVGRMDGSYVVSYEVRPGESMVYDSQTKEWTKRE